MKLNATDNSRKSINPVFYLYSFLIVSIMVIAYNGLIPDVLSRIPLYDKIGHFFLVGFSSYLLNIFLKRHQIKFKSFHILTAPLLVLGFFTIEEFIQQLSPVRSFDLMDLFCDFAGVYFFYLIDKKFPNISSKYN